MHLTADVIIHALALAIAFEVVAGHVRGESDHALTLGQIFILRAERPSSTCGIQG
jgi:hypothetical protein